MNSLLTSFKEVFECNFPEGSYSDVLRFKDWRHRIDLGNGLFTPGYISDFTWYNSFFPTDLQGKAVLDVGANDGLNSFFAERGGASHVTAIDIYSQDATQDHQSGWNPYAIQTAKKHLNSKVDIHSMSVYDVAQLNRRYDRIIISDVITWLHDIPEAIRAIASICDESIVIREGFVKEDVSEPYVRYDRARTGSHFYTPSRQFIKELMQELGFKTIEFKKNSTTGLYDHWVTSFPILHLDKPVRLYSDPWATTPEGELPSLKDQSLMAVGNRFFVRNKGWVDKQGIQVEWIKPRKRAKFIKALIGTQRYEAIKERRLYSTSDAYTVIARR